MRIPNSINQHTAKLPVNSSATIVVAADPYPSAMLHIGRAQKDGFFAGIAGLYSPDGNEWSFYVPPYFLPLGGKTAYKVVATDENGNRTLVASGRLFVIRSEIDDPNDNTMGTADGETFIKYRNGWHRMRVATDDTGTLMFTIEQNEFPIGDYEGDIGYDPKAFDEFDEPYAFNPSTGKFHKVEAFMDDVDVLMARLGEASDLGHESFSLDRNTNLWHRIDTDGSTLVVGGER